CVKEWNHDYGNNW
nr:immunoglobulin heavy chain junction region [Macaca mulatta]MOW46664.1 immunoglobulin heavy chain junction region [Macaca mulatta]MOW47526.1 immunoglobulin heavy chain junction region [Macaca mulatta]MOW47932.1 immunoglobulin heavy chain junction region [Macaca mulatta]MOW50610.1 immunoglobulin heavy chain junction region [Macaca mulatta]